MSKLFFSDIHLSADKPNLSALLLSYLKQIGKDVTDIYVMGDLFEVWLGDDAIHPEYHPILQAFKLLSQRLNLYFIAGNRDFLIGDKFSKLTGFKILHDPTVIDLFGVPTLLLHGDLLCTDDHKYMAFRQMVRQSIWQKEFLALPINQRIELAKNVREESVLQSAQKTAVIMDANLATIKDYCKSHQVTQLIHGHTHRPSVNTISSEDSSITRYVLGDWIDDVSVLTVTKNNYILYDHRVHEAEANELN